MIGGLTALSLLFTLAAIGISETVYLIRKRYAEELPVCIVGSGCHTVLTSKYSKTFGIHNDVLGLIFYIFVSVITALLLIGFPPYDEMIRISAIAIILIGAVMSVYFTYLQAFVIKNWCVWCLISAGTTWIMALIVLLLI